MDTSDWLAGALRGRRGASMSSSLTMQCTNNAVLAGRQASMKTRPQLACA